MVMLQILTFQEWNDELRLLLTELTGRDGQVKAYEPDPQSEAGVAWSKIRAVYGVFKDGVTHEQLTRNRAVTHWLGKIKRISEIDVACERMKACKI